ncbi:MAG: amidohydrolase family protein [Burkholderiales bacterium]
MYIDAHHHFWRLADRKGEWPPASLAPLHRDFAPDDLLPALQGCGIGGTVLVQSLPTLQDTAFLLDLAARHAFVLGVVGWVDMKASDAAAHITALARHRVLKGLRPMLQDLPDDDWIDDAALDPAVHAMLAHGLCFDALVRPRQLRALLNFAQRHPLLPIVIDHAAKPQIAGAAWQQPWQRDIAALAALPNVSCKLSGLLTEAGDAPNDATLQPAVVHLFETFGAERLMWGSDWPVLKLAGEYADWFAMAQRLCSARLGFDAAALNAVFGGNACRFYKLH